MAEEPGKTACVLAAPAKLCMQTFMLRVNKESAMQLFAARALTNSHFLAGLERHNILASQVKNWDYEPHAARHPTLEVLALSPIQLQSLLIPANQGLTHLRQKIRCFFLVSASCLCHSTTCCVRLLYKKFLFLGEKGKSTFKKQQTLKDLLNAAQAEGSSSSFSVQNQLFPAGLVPLTSEQATSRAWRSVPTKGSVIAGMMGKEKR